MQPFRSKLLYKAENTNIIFLESVAGLQKGDILKIDLGYYTIANIIDNKVILDRAIPTPIDTNTAILKTTSFGFFEGEDLQQHILYFGDRHLFNMKSDKSSITVPDALKNFEWDYYGEDKDGVLGWYSFDKVVNANQMKYPLTKQSGEIKEIEINKVRNKWVRCIIKDTNDVKNLKLKEIKFSISATIQPDIAFNNDIPLDLTLNENKTALKTAIYPLGKAPRLYETFYISSQECFSKKGANVKINITGSLDAADGVAAPTPSAQLSWEYWSGDSWKELGVQGDIISDLAVASLPEIKPTKVNGVESLWIRTKLVAGHYGQEIYKEEKAENNVTKIVAVPGKLTPPKITSMSLSYEYKDANNNENSQPGENYLVYSNLEYRNITDEGRSDKIIVPFEMINGSGVHFYLGFDKKPEKGPVSIFFDLDTSIQGNAFSPVQWEYCSQISEGKEKWDRLEVLDNTKGFTQSDTIEFVFSDMFKTKKLGQELYWIRVTELNPNIIKSKIKSIHMNTVWASQMQTFQNVVLGSSDGSADQVYLFPKQPILSAEVWVNEINSLSESQKGTLRMSKTKPVEKKDKDGNIIEFWVKWEGVDNLFTADADSRKYEIDRAAGYIKFGDNSHGRVPAIGRNNIKADYQAGGGINGNVGVREVNTLKTSVAFVDKVFNSIPASGGSNTELMPNAVERGTHYIKNRNRVITKDDYEYMVKEFSSGIAMVKCLSNSKWIDGQIEYNSGDVVVVIIPQTNDDKPVPSIQLIAQVKSYLENFTPATADIQVISPYYWSVNTEISIKTKALEYIPAVEKEVSAKLKEFLHPLRGGEAGWAGNLAGSLTCRISMPLSKR